mmetsp:Transcript_16770/g.40093  ORF Transcript_16770/g.40093 Transcript_16770/m.40093 type:complete len:767 (+) Transcript_16770:309-2609(+)
MILHDIDILTLRSFTQFHLLTSHLKFRYPAAPPPFFLDSSPAPAGGQSEYNGKWPGNHNVRTNKSHKDASQNKRDLGPPPTGSSTNNSSNSASGSIDLFFDLPARVISKLFRPKRPLCGQPLTLNVSGTIFCCRAELFDSQPSTIGEGCNHPLVLFSVIVALAPLAPSTSEETQSIHPTQYFYFNANSSNAENTRSDAAFTTISRVHRNLARLCRVLTREEIRCRYVSRQCNMLLKIRDDYEVIVGPDCLRVSGGSDGGINTAGVDANSSKKGEPPGPPGPPPLSPKEKRMPVPTPAKAKVKDKKSKVGGSDEQMDRPEMSRSQRRDYVQNLIEIMLAASPPVDNNYQMDDHFEGKDLHGNLARELAHVFHWISSPSRNVAFLSRATAQEGVVYINRHIAVPLDPVLDSTSMQRSALHHPSEATRNGVRPYHTILFPNSTPSDILKGLLDETVGVNEMTTSLSRILPHIQPRKSLHEIARDAGLSLPHVMDTARWLVHCGMCVAAMPVLRKNRYACAGGAVTRMAKLALPFWQTFGVKSQHCKFHWRSEAARSPHAEDNADDVMHRRMTASTGAPRIFVIVSAFTTKATYSSTAIQSGNRAAISASPKLGEAIDGLSGADEPNSDELSPHYKRSDSFQYGENQHMQTPASGSRVSGIGKTGISSSEEIIYSMAVWLIANKVLVEVKDSLIATEIEIDSKNGNKPATSTLEESLYYELFQSGCLDGNVSIPDICYRFGLDRIRMEKFIFWGQQTNRLDVFSRPWTNR